MNVNLPPRERLRCPTELGLQVTLVRRRGAKKKEQRVPDLYSDVFALVVSGTALRRRSFPPVTTNGLHLIPTPQEGAHRDKVRGMSSRCERTDILQTHIQLQVTPTGINLVSADDFETWYFTVEVFGESLYQVSFLAFPFLESAQHQNRIAPGIRREKPSL
jgi:hypothetical protein